MKRLSLAIVGSFLAGVVGFVPAAFGGAPGAAADALVVAVRAAKAPPGLDGATAGVIGADSRGTRSALAMARANGLKTANQRVRVIIETSGQAGAADAIASVGGSVHARYANLVDAFVPPSGLSRLARADGVTRVRAPALEVPESVDEAVALMRADAWHSAGIDGAGIKIAIIDLGFAGYSPSSFPNATLVPNGCVSTTETEHGFAVAQIVRAVAPGASLYLICADSDVGLGNAEQYVVDHQIPIVNHSVGWFGTSRGDGSGAPGTPDAIVADARAHGVLWVNAAGNEGSGSHWSGVYTDANQDDVMEWSGGDALNETTIAQGEEACAVLRWDGWPVTSQDFDLGLVRSSTGQLVWSSTDNQAAGPSEPVEGGCYTNTGPTDSFSYVVIRFSATVAPRMDFFYLGDSPLQYWNAGGSVVEPATSPNALAVGAYCWRAPGFGIPTSVEKYSSRGPTVDGRHKPDLIAADGVSGTVYGDATGTGPCTDGFLGTSAAAPHVAGAAALLLQRQGVGTGVAALQAALERGALDIHNDFPEYTESVPPGKNDREGEGAVSLYPPSGGGPFALARNTNYYTAGGYTTNFDNLYVENGDGSASTRLDSIDQWDFTPDATATNLIFSRGAQLFSLPLGGGNPVQVASGGFTSPRLTMDASKMVFSRDGFPYDAIFTANANGTNEVQFTSGSDANRDPVFSPDETKIAWAARDGNDFEIAVRNADGSGSTTFLTNDLYDESSPDFSPDGTKIVYARSSVAPGIYVTNADGSGSTVQLTQGGTEPRYSPDGTEIAFLNNSGIWLMKNDGSALTYAGPGGTSFAWAHSGAGVAAPVIAQDATPRDVIDVPQIDGTTRVGSPLAATTGNWVGALPIALGYRWQRCDQSDVSCADIAGASDERYVPTGDDVGHTIRVRVTAQNAGGAATSSSSRTAVVGAALPVNIALPTVGGTTTPGGLLAVTGNGTWSGSPGSFSYQWRRCDQIGADCTDIAGAGATSYTVQAVDVGAKLRVAVVATNGGGSAPSASAATSVVTKVAQSIAFAQPPDRTFGDPDFAVIASATSGLPVGFAAAGNCTISAGSVHITGAGSCAVTATQSGNSVYSAASAVLRTFAIAKANQTITFGAIADMTLGAADFSVGATATSGLMVAFAANGSCTVAGSTVHLTGAGSCTVTASQSGDANYNAAVSVSQSFAITKRAAPNCAVPKVVGKTLARATRALTRSHCAAGKITHAYSRTVQKGRVSAQSRRAGRVLPNGTKVNLIVSRGRRH